MDRFNCAVIFVFKFHLWYYCIKALYALFLSCLTAYGYMQVVDRHFVIRTHENEVLALPTSVTRNDE